MKATACRFVLPLSPLPLSSVCVCIYLCLFVSLLLLLCWRFFYMLKVSVLNLKRSFLWNQSYSCTMGGGSSKASPKAEPRDEKTERQEKDDEATLTEVPSPCRIICFQLQIIV